MGNLFRIKALFTLLILCGFLIIGDLSYASSNCGDGNIDIGEFCDDANTGSSDGCSSLCSIEIGYSCMGAPSICSMTAACGNGVVEMSELCDDGNTGSNDGCSASCAIETGYSCIGAGPSICSTTASCGNGIVETGEACDDNNISIGDGCSASCTIETGYSCTGSAPSSCSIAIFCGNGIIESGEGCDFGGSVVGCSASCQVEPGYICTTTSCMTPSNGASLITVPVLGEIGLKFSFGDIPATSAKPSPQLSNTNSQIAPTIIHNKNKTKSNNPKSEASTGSQIKYGSEEMVGCMEIKDSEDMIDGPYSGLTGETKNALNFILTYDFTEIPTIAGFQPLSHLTRSQTAKFLSLFAQKIFCKKPDTSIKVSYTDLGDTDEESQKYIILAKQLGIMNGLETDKFYPNKQISSAQFAVSIIRMIMGSDNLQIDSGENRFETYNAIALKIGFKVSEIADPNSRESTFLHRDDVATFLYRLFQYQKSEENKQ